MLQRLSRVIAVVVCIALILVLPGGMQSYKANADTGANWTGNYYNNRDLVGSPVLSRIDPAVVFNWGPYSPGPGIPSTDWSARWTSVQYLNAGTYRFNITADDGVRMYIDGQIILDQWHDEAATTYAVDVQVVSGNHIFQVDYFQDVGDSSISVSWSLIQSTSTAWTAQYWNNPNLQGATVLARFENSINYDWGMGSPDPSVPADYFSARWTATLPFSAATYRFTLAGDDGVRLFIDNIPIIDQWHQEVLTAYSIDVTLPAGLHTLRVEYFELTANAAIHFDYGIAVGPPPYQGSTASQWYGEYYTNTSLSGSPAFVRNDGSSGINFNWSNSTPSAGFPHDNYSVRWTRQVCVTGRPYIFYLTVDDGARFYIDTTLIIDAWKIQSATTYTTTVNLTSGCHTFRLEYFQNLYQAQVLLTWNPPDGQTPPLNLSSPSTGVTATVNTHALNVRSGPGIGFSILTAIARGETYTIVAHNADLSWLKLNVNGLIGWSSAFYVTTSGNVAGLPLDNGPTVTAPVATGVRGQAYATVRVRSGPGSTFAQVDTLDWLSIVDVIGRNADASWFQVRFGNTVGWVSAAYIQIVSGSILNVPITG